MISMILGTSPSDRKNLFSLISSSCSSFSSRIRSLRPVSLRILSIVAFSWASICFLRYCLRFFSLSSLRMTSVASSSILPLRGLRSGSSIKSLISPFCLLVLLLLKFRICSGLLKEASSISSSRSESQLSDSPSASSSTSSQCKTFSTSCCWSSSIISSSSSFSPFSPSMGKSSSSPSLGTSSSSSISSSEAGLLSPLIAFLPVTSTVGQKTCCLRYDLSWGILAASVLGRKPWSCAQWSFSKQKPISMVILDIIHNLQQTAQSSPKPNHFKTTLHLPQQQTTNKANLTSFLKSAHNHSYPSQTEHNTNIYILKLVCFMLIIKSIITNFIITMKHRRSNVEPPVIDQKYLDTIYRDLEEKMSVLDQLNTEHKIIQETHFLRTFMNVIEKLGNELLLAQEAYKNVDLEAKKDNYFVELAEELNFFKKESFTLKEMFLNSQEELKQSIEEKHGLQNQLESTRKLYQKRTKENFDLKSENKLLKMKLKSFIISENMNEVPKNSQDRLSIRMLEQIGQKSVNLAQHLNQSSQSPDFFEGAKSKSGSGKVKGSYLTLATAIPSKRIKNYSALSPVSNSFGKEPSSTVKSSSLTPRSIRSKKVSQTNRRILPQEYNPQTNY